jgi:hypothetical protein
MFQRAMCAVKYMMKRIKFLKKLKFRGHTFRDRQQELSNVWKRFCYTVIPRLRAQFIPSKLLVRWKPVKRKLISHYFPMGITIGLWEEGARISENWLVNWRTGINLYISYKRKLVNRLLYTEGLLYLRILFSPGLVSLPAVVQNAE